MLIDNKPEYKDVSIYSLGLTIRTSNALMRAGIKSLYILIENMDHLNEIHGFGKKSIEETKAIFSNGSIDVFNENDKTPKKSFHAENLQRPVKELNLSAPIMKVLHERDIQTIDQVLDLRSNNYLGIQAMDPVFKAELDEKVSSLIELGDSFFDSVNNETGTRNMQISKRSIRTENLQTPIIDLNLSDRIIEALQKNNIDTVDKILSLSWDDIASIQNLTPRYKKELSDQISQIIELGDQFFDPDPVGVQNKSRNRKFDKETYIKLKENFDLQPNWVCEWYGFSRQRLSQMVNGKSRGVWCGNELLPEESAMIKEMISKKLFYAKYENTECYLLNNKKDDAAILLVSDKYIKCFFLQDLPQDIQILIQEAGLEKYTEEEINAFPIQGQIITIMKEQFFLPEDTSVFRKFAQSRKMTADDYSRFLYGIPYCRKSTSVTDEKIVSYLEDHTVDGITFIPTTPDSTWLRTFITKNNFSAEDFIAFYGFNSNISDNPTVSLVNSPESDMNVQLSMDSMDFIEKVFGENPLLGSAIIPKDELSKIYQDSNKYVNKLLSDPSKRTNLHDDMTLSLAMISHAKEWDSIDETGFWRFMTTKFGYGDSQYKLRNILCGCLQNAIMANRRWFLVKNGENLYKSTIVIHAFSTRRSWQYFCDFLFDFYKYNLNWTYIENDPMFYRMIEALRNKIQDVDDGSDEKIGINSTYYHFREGIVKLILYRPHYASQLAMRMVKRIDELINHSAQPAVNYEEQLCDEWMKNKLQGIANSRRRDTSDKQHTVAVDYTRIKPYYYLHNENQVQIVFPDVRLAENDFDKITMNIYSDGHIVKQKNLNFYGNELGKTMSGFTINLEDYLRVSGTDSIDPQVIIKCDSKELYNSGKTLFRDVIIFKNKTETASGSCMIGGYSFFYSGKNVLNVMNAEISPIIETAFLQGSYFNLQDNFAVFLNNNIICLDSSHNETKPIVNVKTNYASVYTENGITYQIVSGLELIQVIFPNVENYKKFSLVINNKPFDISAYPYKEVDGRRVFEINFASINTPKVIIQLVDFENRYPVFQGFFILIPEFRYSFNKPFLFSITDYDNAVLKLRAGQKEQTIQVMPGETTISIDYQDGKIEIPVPFVKITDSNNNEWNGNDLKWIKTIPQECFLYAKVPENVNIMLSLNSQNISVEKKNMFGLGNALYAYNADDSADILNVYADLTPSYGLPQKYLIGRIAVKEQFIDTPVLTLSEGRLSWDQGHGFIGDKNARFLLTICEGTKYEKEYSITAETETIDEGLFLPTGIYKFKVCKASGNIFSVQKQVIISGDFPVGEINELRFLNKTIQIDSITCEEKSPYRSIDVRKSFIDNIKFVGVEYIESENRECPVYTGIMYFETADGRRREYSYDYITDKHGNKLWKINPVTINLLNENTLIIVNEDGEGFYFCRLLDRDTRIYVYQITDREPTLAYQDMYYYSDLYIFSIKR